MTCFQALYLLPASITTDQYVDASATAIKKKMTGFSSLDGAKELALDSAPTRVSVFASTS